MASTATAEKPAMTQKYLEFLGVNEMRLLLSDPGQSLCAVRKHGLNSEIISDLVNKALDQGQEDMQPERLIHVNALVIELLLAHWGGS